MKVLIRGPKNLFALSTMRTQIHIMRVQRAKKYVNLNFSDVIFCQYVHSRYSFFTPSVFLTSHSVFIFIMK